VSNELHPGLVQPVFAFLADVYVKLLRTKPLRFLVRRIEDARTPVAIWDDPRLTSPADNRVQERGATRASRLLKLTNPRRA
jgi:hypothetical protein